MSVARVGNGKRHECFLSQASLQDELQGHNATQNEFTAQWLQQQTTQLDSISAAVDRLLKQSDGESNSSSGGHAERPARGTAKGNSVHGQIETIDELRVSLAHFQSEVCVSAMSKQRCAFVSFVLLCACILKSLRLLFENEWLDGAAVVRNFQPDEERERSPPATR